MKTRKHLPFDLRQKVVKAYLNGRSIEDLTEIFNVSDRSIYNWLRQSNEKRSSDGPKNDGRGRPSKIDIENGKRLLKILKKPASKFGFETDLWNTSRLKIICHRELKIKVSKMAIWRFLDKFGQSFKKVQKQYYETNVKAQEIWTRSVLKDIKKAIKKYRAILYFSDESCIQLSPVMGKSWGPIGEKIIHKVTGNRGSVSAISAISNDGRLVFNVFDGGKRFNSEDIINFLGEILDHHPRRHLVIVMDRATCHLSKKTTTFIESKSKLHVFYLPARSPQFNPDEQVWAHLKNHDLKSHQETNLKCLKRLTKKKLRSLSRDSKKLRGIFKRCDNAHLYI